MVVKSLDELNLNDSDLIKIEFSEIGNLGDRIIFHLDYILDYQTFETKSKLLVFEKCWKATLDLNFAVAPPDSIHSGIELKDTELLNSVFEKIQKLKLDAPNIIRHFYIETNVANSKINIIADNVLLIDSLSQ